MPLLKEIFVTRHNSRAVYLVSAPPVKTTTKVIVYYYLDKEGINMMEYSYGNEFTFYRLVS